MVNCLKPAKSKRGWSFNTASTGWSLGGVSNGGLGIADLVGQDEDGPGGCLLGLAGYGEGVTGVRPAGLPNAVGEDLFPQYSLSLALSEYGSVVFWLEVM